MKKIIYCLLPIFYFFNGCGTFSDTGTKENKNSENLYLITTNGNTSSLSANSIGTEYRTFLFTSGESRKIYIGGQIPNKDYSSYTQIRLTNSSIWWNPEVKTIYGSMENEIGNNAYYSLSYSPINIPNNFLDPTLYEVYLEIGNTNNPSLGNNNITFEVANETARNFGLDVYQQLSYNSFSLCDKSMKSAFKEMHVPLTTNVANSNLPDEIVNWNNISNLDFTESTLVNYAYKKVYPNIQSINAAVAQYAYEHPNNGLLFYIKDYNITEGTPGDYNGVTIAAGSDGTRLPAVCFVFVKRIKDCFASSWSDDAVKAATIHELGHLWCEGITDNATHNLWHNGDNKNQCIMINPYTVDNNKIPNDITKNIFKHLGFCEGHLQRGMNVSWELKHYAPIGDPLIGGSSQIQLALKNNSISFNASNNINNQLEVQIESDKKDYIQGQLIDFLVKIRNLTKDTIKLYNEVQHVYSYNESKLKNAANPFWGISPLILPPFQEYIYFTDPLKFIDNKEEYKGLTGFPWYYWQAGEYDYYISYELNGVTYSSNKLPIQIEQVPDSLKTAFEDLKDNFKSPHTLNDYEKLYMQYKGTFYEREFLYKLLATYTYHDIISNNKRDETLLPKVKKLFNEFILKYPDTYEAYSLTNEIYSNRKENESLLKEVLDSLKILKKGNKLRTVLNNQKEFWYKDLNKYEF